MEVPTHTKQTFIEGASHRTADLSATTHSVLGAQLAGADAVSLDETAGASVAPAGIRVRSVRFAVCTMTCTHFRMLRVRILLEVSRGVVQSKPHVHSPFFLGYTHACPYAGDLSGAGGSHKQRNRRANRRGECCQQREEQNLQRGQAKALGEMGSRDQGPHNRTEEVGAAPHSVGHPLPQV